tara:strand:- start:65109 stop:65243 length:135 start_codon:yes stop_codon:yes gene_type:complete
LFDLGQDFALKTKNGLDVDVDVDVDVDKYYGEFNDAVICCVTQT